MQITELPTDRDKLVILADFTHTTPDALFNYWIVPELLQKWWPPEAEVEPRLGGTYHFFWRQMNWHLHGHYIEFVPGGWIHFISRLQDLAI